MKTSMLILVVLAVFFLAGAMVARASVSGSIGFNTPLLSEANASPTGNINTSTMFTLEQLVTTTNEQGLFAGLPPQAFGTVTFQTPVGTSLKITDAEFGTFASSSISTLISTSGFLNLEAVGTWKGGTFNLGVCTGGCPADMRISFTQTPSGTGEISFSSTMSTLGTTTVPELPTFALFGTGLMAAIITATKLRRFV